MIRYLLILSVFFVSSLSADSPTPPSSVDYHEVPALALEDEPTFYQEFLHMLWTLGLLLGVLILIAYLLKRIMHTRIQQANVSSSIKILESRALSQKNALHLIQVGEVKALIAEGHEGVTLLSKSGESLDETG